MLGPMRHADPVESGAGSFSTFGCPKPTIGEWQLDVLIDGEVADQVETLEDESDFAVSNPGALGQRQVGDGLAIEPIVPVAPGK